MWQWCFQNWSSSACRSWKINMKRPVVAWPSGENRQWNSGPLHIRFPTASVRSMAGHRLCCRGAASSGEKELWRGSWESSFNLQLHTVVFELFEKSLEYRIGTGVSLFWWYPRTCGMERHELVQWYWMLTWSALNLGYWCSCEVFFPVEHQILFDGTSSFYFMVLTWLLLIVNQSQTLFQLPTGYPEVEKNTACNKLLVEHYPTTCVTKDVFNLLKAVPKAKTWNPRKLVLADDFNCCAHKGKFHVMTMIKCFWLWFWMVVVLFRFYSDLLYPAFCGSSLFGGLLQRCPLSWTDDSVLTIGAPCVSHSKKLGIGLTHSRPRLDLDSLLFWILIVWTVMMVSALVSCMWG